MGDCAFYLKGKAQTQNKKHKHKKDGSEREEAEDESPSWEKQRSLGVANIICIFQFNLNHLPGGLRIKSSEDLVISQITNLLI